MALIDDNRTRRVQELIAALASHPGSEVDLRGSLVRGDADQYSDIDLHWQVRGDGGAALRALPALLGRVGQIAALRFDPDHDPSPAIRVVFVRFTGWPLMSRVDLEITADFTGVPPMGSWSAAESALMNVIAAIKAQLRGDLKEAAALLSRGFARVAAQDPGGQLPARMTALVRAARQSEPTLTAFAGEILDGIDEVDGSTR